MVLQPKNKISQKQKEKVASFPLHFKNVILISYLRNFKNKIVQYSQILIGGAFRADAIDSTKLANVHFEKEAEQDLRKHIVLKKVC